MVDIPWYGKKKTNACMVLMDDISRYGRKKTNDHVWQRYIDATQKHGRETSF